jgi:hypothetical protein
MSYIKPITISEYDNIVNQVNVEQLQSVTQYVTNESQSMNLATNASLVESQSIYSRSNDFNWTAIDNPSEMNYCSNECWPDNCSVYGCCCFLPFFILSSSLSLAFPCLGGILLNDYALRRSQKLKITNTYVDFEYNNCCCFKIKSLISLDDIWLIRNNVDFLDDHKNKFQLYSKDKCVSIQGLNRSSNTPILIKDTIIQRRPKKTQSKPYVIPNITSTLKYGTVSLIPEDACISKFFGLNGYFEVAFIDSLGSVDMNFESRSSILKIVGDNRSDSMTLCFEDDDKDKLCSTFKKAVEDSLDSFK